MHYWSFIVKLWTIIFQTDVRILLHVPFCEYDPDVLIQTVWFRTAYQDKYIFMCHVSPGTWLF